MKFSWTSLNYFLNLTNIKIHNLAEVLTIKGFEIDNIHTSQQLNDYIIDISITANRPDTLSSLGLATEISHILDKPIYLKYQPSQYHNNKKTNITNILSLKYLSSIKYNKILNIKNNTSPSWLKQYLQIHYIESINLVHDIKEYIKLKWGQTIYFFNITDIKNLKNNHIYIKVDNNLNGEIGYNENFLLKFRNKIVETNHDLENYSKLKTILACSYIYNNNFHTNDCINKYSIEGYYEALHLIATFSHGYISKSYSYNELNKKKPYTLNIDKNLIKNTLGPIHTTGSKYLKNKTIYKILQQLKLKPRYNYYHKSFDVTIQQHRTNDLSRKIDIIEEIGRMYGYQNFIDKIPYNNQIGKVSKQYQMVKKIRQYFRDNGIHEVINSSLEKSMISYDNKKNNSLQDIQLFNPLSKDQSNLRNNLIDNLIKNKIYNYKQKNDNVELFEIGKIFINNIEKNIQKESIHFAGLCANKTLIQQSWETKDVELNWFHVKGMLEQFFEKLNIQIFWTPINESNTNHLPHISLKNFNLQKTISINNKLSNQVIGVMGQLNNSRYPAISQHENIFIFEFNLEELIKCYDIKPDFSYIFTNYSVYPSVIRDISIKVEKEYPITDIIEFIYKINPDLIQAVKVFNQYRNINDMNNKYIGIRILYNNEYKTLNQKDLKLIEQNITMILSNYQSI